MHMVFRLMFCTSYSYPARSTEYSVLRIRMCGIEQAFPRAPVGYSREMMVGPGRAWFKMWRCSVHTLVKSGLIFHPRFGTTYGRSGSRAKKKKRGDKEGEIVANKPLTSTNLVMLVAPPTPPRQARGTRARCSSQYGVDVLVIC